MYLTFKYRIKDRNSKKLLNQYSAITNFIWNYCVDIYRLSKCRRRLWPSGFDLNSLTSGSSDELKMPSVFVQAICEQFVRFTKQHKKIPKFRSYKRYLGWIPFKSNCIKIVDDQFKYNKHTFRFWKSRDLPNDPKIQYFCQDIKGNCFVCFVCEVKEQICDPFLPKVGIDLGLKTQLTCSDGTKLEHPNFTKQYEQQLSDAQRHNNKKLIKKNTH